VYVPELKDVVVLVGAIENPGPQPLKAGQTVREFFVRRSLAPQGATFNQERADARTNAGAAAALDGTRVDLANVQIIRGADRAIRVNLTDALKRPTSRYNLALQPGDVIFLPPKEQKQK